MGLLQSIHVPCKQTATGHHRRSTFNLVTCFFRRPPRQYTGPCFISQSSTSMTTYHQLLPPLSSTCLPMILYKCYKHIQSCNDSILLQSDLNHLCDWSHLNGLQFNIPKFSLLRFSNRSNIQSSTDYFMDSVQIEQKHVCRDLGVVLSDDLSWSLHYEQLSKRAYQMLGLLRRTFTSSIPSQSKKLLYLSLIRSRLMYCSQVWRPRLIKDIKTLELIQRRATKYILNDFSSSYKTRLTFLHMLPLMYMFELLDVLFMVKCFKQPDPSFPVFDFISIRNSSTRSGRSTKLVHLSSKSNLFHHSYFHRIVRIWNALPPIDITLSNATIKNKLKEFLWANFLNNFDSDIPCTYHFICPCNRCSNLPARTIFH